MARRSSIDGLPEEVRRWLERALAENNFSGYEALEEMLRGRGYAIGKSSIHRYGQKIERRFAAIKASTEAARFLTEGAADDQDARSEAVIALVQTEMFESITKPAFPKDTQKHIYTNGGIETAIGLGLLLPKTRKLATIGTLGYVAYLAGNAVRNR